MVDDIESIFRNAYHEGPADKIKDNIKEIMPNVVQIIYGATVIEGRIDLCLTHSLQLRVEELEYMPFGDKINNFSKILAGLASERRIGYSEGLKLNRLLTTIRYARNGFAHNHLQLDEEGFWIECKDGKWLLEDDYWKTIETFLNYARDEVMSVYNALSEGNQG